MGSERPVTAVVLAGGASTRFDDGHKAAASLHGRTILGRVLDAVRGGTTEEPILVVSDEAQRRALLVAVEDVDGESVRLAYDTNGFDGPLAGVYGAIDAVDTEWLFLGACDMPLVSPAAIRFLADHCSPDVDAVVPITPSGEYEPLHALYRCEALSAVEQDLPAAAGVRFLLDGLAAVEPVPVVYAPEGVPLRESTTNVNTRADLADLRG